MPIIARFYGLIIKMYFQQREHNPPHIHAFYGEYMGAIDIRNGEMLEGDLPPKALAMVREWINEHKRCTNENLGYTRIYPTSTT